jgi:membrane protein insertase Oxa1/YidC/SpoIIIJ
MKWMMVFMFPLLMYNAPCGLTLYFIVNSTLGIMESKYIRSHMAKYEKERAERGETQKGQGFLARLQAMAEERQKQMLKAKGMQPPRKRV